MKILTMAAVFVMGCGPASDSRIDAAVPKNDAAVPGNSGPTACKSHKKVTTSTTDGSRTETTTFFIVRADIKPGDDFSVVACDYVQFPAPGVPTCPVGFTCVETGDTLPTGRNCYSTKGSGSFLGDALYVTCGSESRTINAQGIETAHNANYYSSVTIKR